MGRCREWHSISLFEKANCVLSLAETQGKRIPGRGSDHCKGLKAEINLHSQGSQESSSSFEKEKKICEISKSWGKNWMSKLRSALELGGGDVGVGVGVGSGSGGGETLLVIIRL